MIRYSKLHALLCLFLVFLVTFVQPLVVFADVMTSSNAFKVNQNYLIGSSSNADPYGIMTLDLVDHDYSVMPLSSLGSVTNTVYDAMFTYSYFNTITETHHSVTTSPAYSGGKYHFSVALPDNCVFNQIIVHLDKVALPSPGSYAVSFDMASDFSYTIKKFFLYCLTTPKNAARSKIYLYPSYDAFSGEVYMQPYNVNLSNLAYLDFVSDCDLSEGVRQIDVEFSINFTRIDSNSSLPSTGPDYSSEDYQSDVSGSLSDISSSIGDMSESLDSAAENLEYISTSQNLIIQGIDNVIMHISDQLYAFWDQLYNLIHEPTYARLGDILDAIRNLDLEITVEMTEVTNAVNKMNQEVQNKLQQTTDKITGGFDNSGINQDAAALDSSLQEYEQAEQNVLDNVNDSLNDFEFDSGLDEYKTSVQVFSDFLQALYESAGAFKIVINLSLMLSVAGIVIGLYRFKDGG